jgi:phosphatidylserine/phosphatidylglycerophosphate/cardiolipin synthase-like enzyme
MANMKERILSCISDTKNITYEQLQKQFDPKSHYLLEIHIANLIDQGLISIKDNGKSKSFSIKQKIPKESIKQETETVQSIPYEIVATLPESILSVKHDVLTTRKVLRELFNSARNEILVSQPFLDNTFVEIYEDEIRQLAKNGTRFILLTRKVSTDTVTVKGILKIFEMYAMQSNASKFEVYEHWVPLRIDNENSRQFVGLHAKLVMVDNEAYLGSANWTGYSLSNNVEMGLIMREKSILNQLRDLFFLVAAQSTRIDMEKIHQKATSKTDDFRGK